MHEKPKKKKENSKNLHKGEEICKNSKNINELINKQLIKLLIQLQQIKKQVIFIVIVILLGEGKSKRMI